MLFKGLDKNKIEGVLDTWTKGDSKKTISNILTEIIDSPDPEGSQYVGTKHDIDVILAMTDIYE